MAEDHFKLGVREGDWKYIFDIREGIEELYDLDRDPAEQHNLAKTDPVAARGCASASPHGPRPTADSTSE